MHVISGPWPATFIRLKLSSETPIDRCGTAAIWMKETNTLVDPDCTYLTHISLNKLQTTTKCNYIQWCRNSR